MNRSSRNHRKPRRDFRAALIGSISAIALLIPAMGASSGSSMIRLAHHALPASKLASSRFLGHMDSQTHLKLVIPLKPSDPDGLAALIQRQYDPRDSLYHHFITPAEYNARFAATPATVASVTTELTNLGLNVTNVAANHGAVEVEGSVATIESAFSTEIDLYEDSEGRTIHAPKVDPLVTQTLADNIRMIAGLHDALHAHHHARPLAISNQVFTNPVPGFYNPSGIKTAYNVPTGALNGSGQTLGLFECDGYTKGDIDTYASQFGLPAPNLTNKTFDNFNGAPSSTSNADSGAAEVTLDIEMMVAMAPSAAIRVYEIPTACGDTDWLAAMNAMTTDNPMPMSISTSWAFAEADGIATDEGFLESENQIYSQMASQGQSFFAAAGDTGSDNDSPTNNTTGVEDPAAQPYVVGVGGTSLTTQASGAYTSEAVWNDLSTGNGAGGGGISQKWSAPSWQVNLATSANGGAASGGGMRMVPDVSLNADPNDGYNVYFGSVEWIPIGGTSAAAPLWAAFIGLVNQQRANSHLTAVGFPNPSLYQLAEGNLGAGAYHDITQGNNGVYYAAPGYDLASGWGSFNGANFLAAFAPAGLPPVTPTNFKVTAVGQ